MCGRCEVGDQCLAWALRTSQDAGIWGGKTEDERRTLRRSQDAGGRPWSPSVTGVGMLMLVAALAALAGAGMTTALLRRAERRCWRWLDQRAAERAGRWWTRQERP